ncbi:hypothetical protein DYB37_012627 [Aphanomyces astaci]|uniref:Uncharacterized protein n=1 Tax=Aphanomyces astaci TaxID=112090 RepID=A0A3R7BXL7_APHAT|nr:hypothetical protein DYB35_007682 [Aphanomyces astaci]RHZ26574.1 hypothetical protein DYB37_012627 [Aphanomyces astaci]
MARDGKRKALVKAESHGSPDDGDDASAEDDEDVEQPRAPTIEDWKRQIEVEVQQAIPGALRMCVSNAKKQKHDLMKHTIEGVTAARNLAPLAKEHSMPLVDRLKQLTKEYALINRHIGAFDSKLTDLERTLQAGPGPQSFNGLLDMSAFHVADDVLSKHEYIKQFDAAAGIEREDEDDEDVMVQESNSVRSMSCPITQMLMTEPMRK